MVIDGGENSPSLTESLSIDPAGQLDWLTLIIAHRSLNNDVSYHSRIIDSMSESSFNSHPKFTN